MSSCVIRYLNRQLAKKTKHYNQVFRNQQPGTLELLFYFYSENLINLSLLKQKYRTS